MEVRIVAAEREALGREATGRMRTGAHVDESMPPRQRHGRAVAEDARVPPAPVPRVPAERLTSGREPAGEVEPSGETDEGRRARDRRESTKAAQAVIVAGAPRLPARVES